MWTAELTVDFTPLPKEKEAAYWSALHYFAEVMYEELKKEILATPSAELEVARE